MLAKIKGNVGKNWRECWLIWKGCVGQNEYWCALKINERVGFYISECWLEWKKTLHEMKGMLAKMKEMTAKIKGGRLS